MQPSKLKEVLEQELKLIKPSACEISEIKAITEKIVGLLGKELKKEKANAKIIVGGSFSKNTLIKKEHYDIDIFVRFDESYQDKNISEILESAVKRILNKLKPKARLSVLKGSRDYFSISFANQNISAEIIPILKPKSAKQAVNVTDLSPSHVVYVKKCISKSKKANKKASLEDEIRLLKAFCYANDCYGAESYIRGFSGYSLELLVCYYGSFLNLIRASLKFKPAPAVLIDPAKAYKNNEALALLNEAKIQSPLILIDPTFKERNATASLSLECFNKFISACRKFLANPSMSCFEQKKASKDELEKTAKNSKAMLFIVNAQSNKTKDDVAGAKLKKFFICLSDSLKKEFLVLKSELVFNLSERKAEMFFVLKQKGKEMLVKGPPANMQKAAECFKKRWKSTFVKSGFVYAKRKAKTAGDVLKENMKDLKERGISKLAVSVKQF